MTGAGGKGGRGVVEAWRGWDRCALLFAGWIVWRFYLAIFKGISSITPHFLLSSYSVSSIQIRKMHMNGAAPYTYGAAYDGARIRKRLLHVW